MLRPQDAATRERRSLNGLGQFAPDFDGVGRDQGWCNAPLPNAREIPVPASYNDIFADAEVRNHVGDVWYQTLVRVPARWAGERIVLR
jgi:beta-glucuronidase